MSIRAMNWAWQVELEPSSKLLLLALADIADDKGLAWPSVSTLARKSCVSVRTAQRVLRQLASLPEPLLKVSTQHSANGRQRTNAYQLLMGGKEGDNLAPSPPTRPGEGDSGDGERVAAPSHREDDVPDTPEGDKALSSEPPQEPPPESKTRTTRRRPVDKPLTACEQRELLRLAREVPSETAEKLFIQLAQKSRGGQITSPVAWMRAAVARIKSQATA